MKTLIKNEARYWGKCVKLCNSDLHHFEHDRVGLAYETARDQFFCWKKNSSAKTSVEVRAPLQQPHRHVLGGSAHAPLHGCSHWVMGHPQGPAWGRWGIHPWP